MTHSKLLDSDYRDLAYDLNIISKDDTVGVIGGKKFCSV